MGRSFRYHGIELGFGPRPVLAGFAASPSNFLPSGIDDAAASSRTIRYQLEAVRAYAALQDYQIIREEAFLEIEPDRGSDLILEPLHKIEAFCRAENAILLYVDFSDVQGWRSHLPMQDWSSRTRIETLPISPEPMTIDGKRFDPREHFRAWRKSQHEWSAGKIDRIARARARAEELHSHGKSFVEIADILNGDNLRSATGKPWNAEMTRKLL